MVDVIKLLYKIGNVVNRILRGKLVSHACVGLLRPILEIDSFPTTIAVFQINSYNSRMLNAV